MTSVFATTQVSCPHILPYLVEPFTWRNPAQLKLFLHTILFFLPPSPLLTTVLKLACILSMHVFINLTLPCVIITIHKFNAHFYSNKTYHILHNLLWLAFFSTQNHMWGLPIMVHLEGGHSVWLLTLQRFHEMIAPLHPFPYWWPWALFLIFSCYKLCWGDPAWTSLSLSSYTGKSFPGPYTKRWTWVQELAHLYLN